MAANEYEPSAEQVEALAKELHEAYRSVNRGCIATWAEASSIALDGVRAEARFILRRQHAREAGLLEALRQVARSPWAGISHADFAREALAAHAKLDAKPEPTLLEAAKAVINNSAAPFAAFDALKAAVEREDRSK